MTNVEHVGLFELALSFANDAATQARAMEQFTNAYGFRCYAYTDHFVDQAGFDIFEVMASVYRAARAIIVLNSPLYGHTPATAFELDTIRQIASAQKLFIVELGGASLDFGNRYCVRYADASNATAIAMMLELRRVW